MAEEDISGFDGDVSIAGHGGEAYAWSLNITQNKKDASRYGGSRWGRQRGGALNGNGNVSVFLRRDGAGTAPNADALDPDGDAMVLTASAGCTYTGNGVLDFSINHTFTDPAIEGTYAFVTNGDWVEAWDES